jgi:hypothetical protein
VCTGLWWENLREKKLGRPERRREKNIKVDIQELGRGVWTGLSWLRIDRGNGHL